jgi:hypothetical protein
LTAVESGTSVKVRSHLVESEKSQAGLGLRERARRYMDLAETFSNSRTIDKLKALAAEFDKDADEIVAELAARTQGP